MKYLQRWGYHIIYFVELLVFLVLYAGAIQAADMLYVVTEYPSSNTDSVSVIDVVSKKVVASIPVNYPTHIIANPAGTHVYAITDRVNLSVIETRTNQLTHTVFIGNELNPGYLSTNSDNSLVYISTYQPTAHRDPNQGGGQILVLDATDNKIITSYSVKNYPYRVIPSPKGNTLYISYTSVFKNLFSSIDVNTPIDRGYEPANNRWVSFSSIISDIDIDPTGNYLYIGDIANNKVLVVDVKTNETIATIPVGEYPNGVIMNSIGSRVYTLNLLGHNISVIDTSNNSVIATIPVIDELGLPDEKMQQNPQPYEMVINASNTFMYVTILNNTMGYIDLIAVIDLKENKLVDTIPAFIQIPRQKIAVISTNEVPTSLMSGSGKAINGLGSFVNTTSSFAGGISMDNINYVAQLTAPPTSTLSAKGNMTVDAADIGKSADLLWVVGVENNAPFDGGVDTTYFVMDEMGNTSTVDLYNQPDVWMNQVAEKPFKRNVTLQKETAIDEIKLNSSHSPSVNYHFMGYRLHDGTLIYSSIPIIAKVQ